jgi:4'-phosphopantetheinyl transferase
MPVIEERKISPGGILGIWEIKESAEELEQAYEFRVHEKEIFSSFAHAFRRTQWIATRLLLKHLVAGSGIRYDDHGKPHLDNHRHISVSHSGAYITILVENETCGVDIETIRPKINRIASKFLSEGELIAASEDPALDRMHVYWCAKEAIYKAYGKKNISLRTDIFVTNVDSVDGGTATAVLTEQGEKYERLIQYEKFRDCMLAWTQPVGK